MRLSWRPRMPRRARGFSPPRGGPDIDPDPRILELLADLPRERTYVLPALLRAQRADGYVSDGAVQTIGAYLRLTPNDVEGIATGYADLRRKPPAPLAVRVCAGLSCWTQGSAELLRGLRALVSDGQDNADVEVAEGPCLFVCALAPAAEVRGNVIARASVQAVARSLSDSSPPSSRTGGLDVTHPGRARD